MEIEFNTYTFQASHGKAPRGRGSWAFSLDRAGRDHLIFSPSMTYGEAKRWAREEYKRLAAGAELDFIQVYVQP